MRSFLRTLLRRRPRSNKESQSQSQHSNNLNQTRTTMAGGMTAAVLYACTMTSPSALSAVPEDAEARAHHLKNGKGFTNPWESWKEMSAAQIGRAMAW